MVKMKFKVGDKARGNGNGVLSSDKAVGIIKSINLNEGVADK